MDNWKKMLSKIFLWIGNACSAILLWGGRLMDALGFPEAAKIIATWSDNLNAADWAVLSIILFSLILVLICLRTKKPEPEQSAIQTPEESGSSPAKSESGTLIQNVTSHHQSGGVTAHTYVNEAPPPQLNKISEEHTINADGTHTTSILLEVIAPYPPGALHIKTIAKGIKELDIMPERTGPSMTGHSGIRDEFAFTSLIKPYGRNTIRVTTQDQSPVSIEYWFE